MMAKNKKPPKRRQRIVPVDPINLVIDGMKLITEEERASIMNPCRLALHALTIGEGTHEDWVVVRGVLNVATAVDWVYFSEQYVRELAQAVYAHAMCGKRYLDKGHYGYAGPELEAVKFALEVHAEHLKQLTFRELSVAVDPAINQFKKRPQ